MEDVIVVVLPLRPPVSKVQELKGKECTVGGRSAVAARSYTKQANFRLLYLCKAERGGCAGMHSL